MLKSNGVHMKFSTVLMMIKILKTLSESILPIFFWVLMIFGMDVPYIAILTIIAAVIHEIGHIEAIRHLSSSAKAPRAHLSGFRIKSQDNTSYRDNSIILAMGPLFNIAFYIFTLPFRKCLEGYVGVFGTINLITAISNLLPVEGYDGYGMLAQLFMSKNLTAPMRILEGISFVFSVCATFFSLYLIDKFGSGYWIFGIFFILMISKLVKSGKYGIY